MKITNFGTSHGDPTLEHFCSSTLLETQGRYYLIDAGEPANALLVRNGLCASRVSAVFITHMHIDHTGSLPVICEQAKKYPGCPIAPSPANASVSACFFPLAV